MNWLIKKLKTLFWTTKKINGDIYKLVINSKKIKKRYVKLVRQIIKDYQEKTPPLLITVIPDAKYLSADLARILSEQNQNFEIDNLVYRRHKNGNIRICDHNQTIDVVDRNVIIVQALIDSGNSLKQFAQIINSYKPLSLSCFCLGSKNNIPSDLFKNIYQGFALEKNQYYIGESGGPTEFYKATQGLWIKIK